MIKAVGIRVLYSDGSEHDFQKESSKWLFIVASDDGFKQICLSGDDKSDAYLLRVLENAVVLTMNTVNKYST